MKTVSFDLPYGTSKKSNSSGKVAVLRMGNLQDGEIDYSDLVYSSDEADIEKYYLLENDLLFNRTNSAEWVGKTSIYRGENPAIYAGYLIRIRTPLCGEYLNAVMNSAYAKNYCIRVKTDAVNQSNINAQKLGMFLVPVAPIEEQHRIVISFKQTFEFTQCIQSEKKELSVLIQSTKAKILDLAIRGQLVPQDPAEEPASVLLERIRAEKEELIKQGKIKRDKKESVIFRGEDNSYYEKIGCKVVNIDDEIPFELPVGWAWCRFAEVIELFSGQDLTPDRYSEIPQGIPYITGASNLYNGTVIVNRWTSSATTHATIGDLLLTVKGSGVGKMAICDIADAHIARQIMALRCRNGITQEYLRIVVSAFLTEITDQANGIIPGIRREVVLGTLFPFPPLSEQRKISEKVNWITKEFQTIEKSLN